jgi:hypothetical protein
MTIEKIEDFKKIQQNCSNIFLIDENLCLGNSYEVINHNFQTLSSALSSFETDIKYFNKMFTYFAANSSKYIEINNNLKEKTNTLNDLYTLVVSNSASWTKTISIFYNELISVSEWDLNKNSYPQTKFLNWINKNFPPINFNKNQTLVLYVNLYENLSFRFDKGFRLEYYEQCYIPPTKVVLTCNDRTCGTISFPGRGGNWTGVYVDEKGNKTKVKGCSSPYTKCKKRPAAGGINAMVECPITGSKTLRITHRKDETDRHISTSLGFIYENINSNWSYIKKI